MQTLLGHALLEDDVAQALFHFNQAFRTGGRADHLPHQPQLAREPTAIGNQFADVFQQHGQQAAQMIFPVLGLVGIEFDSEPELFQARRRFLQGGGVAGRAEAVGHLLGLLDELGGVAQVFTDGKFQSLGQQFAQLGAGGILCRKAGRRAFELTIEVQGDLAQEFGAFVPIFQADGLLQGRDRESILRQDLAQLGREVAQQIQRGQFRRDTGHLVIAVAKILGGRCNPADGELAQGFAGELGGAGHGGNFLN